MAVYEVVQPLIVVRDAEGQQHMLYQGSQFSDENLDAEHVEMLLDEGFIAEPSEPEEKDGPPAKSAPKGDWEAFARTQGASDEDLDGLTKDELVSTYGA